MTYEEIIAKIKDILAYKLGLTPEVISDDSNIKNDLGADSLDRIEIVMVVEDEFDIEISDASLEGVRTVSDYAKLVEKLLDDK